MDVVNFMHELIRLAPRLREAGVLRFGSDSCYAELAPPEPPEPVEKPVVADEDDGPLDLDNIRLRAYDAPDSK